MRSEKHSLMLKDLLTPMEKQMGKDLLMATTMMMLMEKQMGLLTPKEKLTD